MHQTHRPRRLLALLAVVGISAGGMLAASGNAHADGPTPRDGWCKQGEGQSVVIDWGWLPDAEGSEPPVTIRCIQLAPGAYEYPVEGDPSPLTDPLASAGIPYEVHPTTKLVTSIDGKALPSGPDFGWHWSTGKIAADGVSGTWEGEGEWIPEAGMDTVVGITVTGIKDSDSPLVPVPFPQFDPEKYDNPFPPVVKPSPTPTETPSSPAPSASATPTTSATPSPSPSSTPTATQTTTQPAIQTPTPVAPSTPPASPSRTASASTSSTPTAARTTTPRAQRTTRQPRRTTRPRTPTTRPQPPVNQQPPPVQQPPPPPPPPIDPAPVEPPPTEPALPADPSGEGTDIANPPPTRVWGREDAVRQSEAADRQDTPAPWSQLAAIAGAFVVVGGLGTAFARGLHTSQPPVVEEE
ncbi:MAG: hypothetical protein Q4P15_12800 [Propionibacteriaceae bacterium]|nr:hypothetical protein [Propionibacteriaceae bacterium]